MYFSMNRGYIGRCYSLNTLRREMLRIKFVIFFLLFLCLPLTNGYHGRCISIKTYNKYKIKPCGRLHSSRKVYTPNQHIQTRAQKYEKEFKRLSNLSSRKLLKFTKQSTLKKILNHKIQSHNVPKIKGNKSTKNKSSSNDNHIETHKRIVARLFDSQPRRSLSDFVIGQKYEGQIISIVKYGLYVDIGSTIDGLVHIKDISEKHFIDDIESKFRPGEKIEVWVKFRIESKKKLGLSLFPISNDRLLMSQVIYSPTNLISPGLKSSIPLELIKKINFSLPITDNSAPKSDSLEFNVSTDHSTLTVKKNSELLSDSLGNKNSPLKSELIQDDTDLPLKQAHESKLDLQSIPILKVSSTNSPLATSFQNSNPMNVTQSKVMESYRLYLNGKREEKVKGRVMKYSDYALYLDIGLPELAYLHIRKIKLNNRQRRRKLWEIFPYNSTVEAFIYGVNSKRNRISLSTFEPTEWDYKVPVRPYEKSLIENVALILSDPQKFKKFHSPSSSSNSMSHQVDSSNRMNKEIESPDWEDAVQDNDTEDEEDDEIEDAIVGKNGIVKVESLYQASSSDIAQPFGTSTFDTQLFFDDRKQSSLNSNSSVISSFNSTADANIDEDLEADEIASRKLFAFFSKGEEFVSFTRIKKEWPTFLQIIKAKQIDERNARVCFLKASQKGSLRLTHPEFNQFIHFVKSSMTFYNQDSLDSSHYEVLSPDNKHHALNENLKSPLQYLESHSS